MSNHQSLHPLLPQSLYSGQGKLCGGQEEDPSCLAPGVSGEWGAALPLAGQWAEEIKNMTQLNGAHITQTMVYSHKAGLG